MTRTFEKKKKAMSVNGQGYGHHACQKVCLISIESNYIDLEFATNTNGKELHYIWGNHKERLASDFEVPIWKEQMYS